jgi:enoyl-CoA hydratase
MYTTILTELNEGILTITVNRPDKLNALNRDVFNDLDKVMDTVYQQSDIRSVIITGAGPKAFVAGADITEFSALSVEEAKQLSRRGQAVFHKIEQSPKPVVAAVNGFALGGGCELAMACHFRICSEQARFGQPEVNLGLIPGYGGTQRLTQLVGKGKSMEWQMSARMIDAREALAAGLVNYVTDADGLLPKAIEILQLIQTKAPLAVAKIIHCVNVAAMGDSAFSNGKSGFEVEVEDFGACFATEDMKEGTTAFVEKRKAQFTGK